MTGQQLQVLKALDVAKTQWYHFTAVLIAVMRFFTDAYDLSCIPLITKLLGRIYYHKEGSYTFGYLPNNVAVAVIGVTFCGTIEGRPFFGWLGDKMGRKHAYGMTLMLVVLAFGIEGDYSLSTIIMFEHANKKTRGAFIAAISAMQGFEILAGGMVAIIASAAFNAKFVAPIYAIDRIRSTVLEFLYLIWLLEVEKLLTRASLGRATIIIVIVGMRFCTDLYDLFCIPLVMKLLDRIYYHKEGSYTRSYLSDNVVAAVIGVALCGTIAGQLFVGWLGNKMGSKRVYGMTLMLVVVYSIASGLSFGKDLKAFTFSSLAWNREHMVFAGHCILHSESIPIGHFHTVLGYWFRVALIDKIDKVGWFAIQLMGFFFMTVFMFALAILYHYWTISEIFPARLRSTYHGISIAAGKVGAMVGAFGFSAAMHAIGLRKVFIVLGVVNFLGMMFTFFVPKSQGKSLEQISGEANVETADAENGTST
ncbi:hypothetical protein JRO89_XS03G0040100 [Xanthoceras sorbifolium]|uniref:Major facilitator superfamily (MFS) profile domain-containing protein n=1 Tax=Xanthoceras sorbifolium TaxID=99658 RepID=A0ABQ8I8H8_9ROSI|nr:hypothetical protein JRO89_XS03G0040100 [Xanthoceras sorbifolium]